VNQNYSPRRGVSTCRLEHLAWNNLEQYRLEQHRDGQGSDQPAYCRSPIHVSDTTSEFPGFCGSYFTEVGSPSRQECRFTQCRR
jgi:hypothetical protein